MSQPRFCLPILLALVLALAAASPAAATSSTKGPHYTLTVSEGESTLPEYEPVAYTSGSVDRKAEVAVSIVRGGLTVYRNIGEEGGTGFPQVPQTGDVVTLESPVGTVIGSIVYDGLPSIDASVCAGSTNFSGANSPGYVVEGFYEANELVHPYHRSLEPHRVAFGEAQVKSLSGSTFGGSFLTPLALGEDVIAKESLKTPLTGEATFTYVAETERPVGSCPVPVPVYAPPPPPALSGGLAKLLHGTIAALLKAGLKDSVRINQAGTVIQDLYLKNGALPAFASRASKHHSKTRALLLAHGTTSAKAAGTVKVTLRVTRHGRSRLKHAHEVAAILLTTLRSSNGTRLNLPRRTLTLHH